MSRKRPKKKKKKSKTLTDALTDATFPFNFCPIIDRSSAKNRLDESENSIPIRKKILN